MQQFIFGIEAEYALMRRDGTFMDFSNTIYREIQDIIDTLPDHKHSGLRIGNAGVKVKNWYIEGDERFTDAGEVRDVALKGIEVRTPLCDSIEEATTSLQQLRSVLVEALSERNILLTSIGFNPYQKEYAPKYSAFEDEYHAAHEEYAFSNISTLTYGPDLNFSSPDFTPDQLLKIARRLTFYSPYIVPFSFSAPFYNGTRWDGYSYRTFVRTGNRPAVTVFTTLDEKSLLVKAPRIPKEDGRIEFKAFDAIADDALYRELLYLLIGIAGAPDEVLPGLADAPDKAAHEHSARHAFDDQTIFDTATLVLAAAQEQLRVLGMPAELPRVEQLLHDRVTPAHAMIEAYTSTATLFKPL